MIQKIDNKGMSVLEMIIVITIFVIVFSSMFTVLGNLFERHSLISKGDEVVQTLREARHDAVSEKGDALWGVYFDTSANRYILFKGSSYASRDTLYDRILTLSSAVSFYSVSVGGGSEVVFDKLLGNTSHDGRIVLASSESLFTININRLGLVDYDY